MAIMKKKLLLSGIVLATLFVLWAGLGYYAARYLTSRRPEIFKRAPWNVSRENIELVTGDSIHVSAWYIRGSPDKAVIILAGIGADRNSCIRRAEFYLSKGYSVLLPDLRCTGKSSGNVISFGWHERKDLLACYQFLKEKGFRKIAAHGCSLGAATIVYALPEIKDFSFIVLESCYDTLDHAFANRTKKYLLPDFCYLPVRYFVKERIGTDPEELRPEEFIVDAQCPALLMAGDAEVQIKPEETQALYKRCSSTYKKLHIFHEGKHEDFKAKYGKEYDQALEDFLSGIAY